MSNCDYCVIDLNEDGTEKLLNIRINLIININHENPYIECNKKLKSLLLSSESSLLLKLKNKNVDINEIINDIMLILSQRDNEYVNSKVSIPCIEYYSNLMKELNPLKNNIDSLSTDLYEICLKYEDSNNLIHILKIYLNDDFPKTISKISTCLPLPFEYIKKNENVLLNIYNDFVKEVKKYELFWLNMNDLDKNCWILEPENPQKSDIIRRISIGNNCSILIKVNPLDVGSLCECTFLGNENYINVLRSNFNENISKWNNNELIRNNLSELLEIEFPSKSSMTNCLFSEMSSNMSSNMSNNSGIMMECGICYMYKIEYNGNKIIPEIVCNHISFFVYYFIDLFLNENYCNKIYHKSCLYEWIQSLNTTKSISIFGTVYGKCVYCQSPISVTM